MNLHNFGILSTTLWILLLCPHVRAWSGLHDIRPERSEKLLSPQTASATRGGTVTDDTADGDSRTSSIFSRKEDQLLTDRRSFVTNVGLSAITTAIALGIPVSTTDLSVATAAAAAESDSDLSTLMGQIQKARDQLAPVPKMIEDEKWDLVRAALIEPPLADCWAKTNRPLLQRYAEAVGDAGGDELAALELREDLVSHLRYLDMAVYNNVFNPITVEGKSGATKELIRSYYEDPINEFKASIVALDELISLSKGL